METEKKDAKLAWMIHERDNAYSRLTHGSNETAASSSNMEEGSGAERVRRMRERDVAHAKRNQREDGSTGTLVRTGSEYDANEMTNCGVDNPRFPYSLDSPRRSSVAERESELRRVHESDTIKSQINMNLERENSVGRMSSVETDAEMARRIHERDLAYAKKNGSHEGRDDFGRVAEDTELLEEIHNRGTSDYDKWEVDMWEDGDARLVRDARLARDIAQSESDYEKKVQMDRMLAKQMQDLEGPYDDPQNDLKVAQRIQMEQERTSSSSPYTYMQGYDREVLMNEQPRAKTPATEPESPQDEGEVPCQYCDNLFPFEVIMEHQVNS